LPVDFLPVLIEVTEFASIARFPFLARTFAPLPVFSVASNFDAPAGLIDPGDLVTINGNGGLDSGGKCI
jgi:hypothetical protein